MHLHRNSCEPLGRIRCRSCGGLRQALPHILHHARDGFVRHSLRACGHPQLARCAGGEGGEHSLADGLAELLRDRRPANLHYDLGRHRVANVLGEGLAPGFYGGGGRPGVWWHRSAVLERCPSRCPSRRRLGGDGGRRGGGDRGGRGEQWRGKYPRTGGVIPEVGFVHTGFGGDAWTSVRMGLIGGLMPEVGVLLCIVSEWHGCGLQKNVSLIRLSRVRWAPVATHLAA
mmetsp:Transcript_83315/g.268548  ORF Transcript_83315/g.268548 Transcript_83315/m.268548 type:complete len:229 (+) Transcript_83315:1199-1885(+)